MKSKSLILSVLLTAVSLFLHGQSPEKAYLKIFTQPPNAEVFINGRPSGTTPGTFKVVDGIDEVAQIPAQAIQLPDRKVSPLRSALSIAIKPVPIGWGSSRRMPESLRPGPSESRAQLLHQFSVEDCFR